MKRLFGLIVLIALAAVAYYYWKGKPASAQQAAQGAAAEARNALDKVGDKIRETKTTGSVKAAFELNRELGTAKIDVDADENGAVTLKGQVPSEQVRALAGRVAAAVPDVKSVSNQLAVNASLPGADAGGRTMGESLDDKTVETKVSLAFSLNRNLKGTDLKVQSYQRHLTLGGTVESESQRQQALEVARQTPSVLDVTDQIAVRAGGAATGPTAATPDGGRVRRVEQALAGNASLAAYPIKVREEGGRILLTGHVKTAAEKDLAGVLAREAAGSGVDNTLAVGP